MECKKGVAYRKASRWRQSKVEAEPSGSQGYRIVSAKYGKNGTKGRRWKVEGGNSSRGVRMERRGAGSLLE